MRARHEVGGTRTEEGGQYSHGHINDVIGAGLLLLYILGGARGGGLVALVTKRDSGRGGVGSVIQ